MLQGNLTFWSPSIHSTLGILLQAASWTLTREARLNLWSLASKTLISSHTPVVWVSVVGRLRPLLIHLDLVPLPRQQQLPHCLFPSFNVSLSAVLALYLFKEAPAWYPVLFWSCISYPWPESKTHLSTLSLTTAFAKAPVIALLHVCTDSIFSFRRGL